MAIFKGLFLFAATLMLVVSPICSAVSIKPNSTSKILPNGAKDYFAKVNEIQLHYIEMGKGPLVILLHGWPETSYAWNKTMSVLSNKYRVVALYGFPKNQRDNINEQEERALKKLAQDLLDAPDSELKDMIANGDLYEVKS